MAIVQRLTGTLVLSLFLFLILPPAAAEVRSPIEARDAAVQKLLSGETAGKRVLVYPERLQAGDEIDSCHRVALTAPCEGYAVFLDDAPFANFSHPCRYVFVDREGSVLLEQAGTMPPDRMDQWLEMDTVAHRKLMAARNVRAPRAAAPAAPRKTSRGGEYYAVLMNGGYDSSNNHVRYWNDLSFIYTTLVDVYGYKDENIIVLCSDGLNPAPDQSNGLNSLPDLDGDGDDDIMYSCVLANVQNVFAQLAATLTENDQLFIFTTDHGSSVNGWSTDENLWNHEVLHDWQFQDLIDALPPLNLVVTLEPCYSGGFLDNTTHKAPRVFSSACLYSETSWAMPPDYVYDTYVFFWTGAVNGTDPLGGVHDADLNGDKLVSMSEAFLYAQAHDFSDETPQYSDNPSGLGENLFLGEGPALVFTFPEGLPEQLPPGPETRILLGIEDGKEQYVPDTARFHYRADPADPYTEGTVTDLGGGLFEALMPNTKPSEAPEYYFSAGASGGGTVCSPFKAPEEVYSFDVCFVETVMEDDFEAEGGWTVQNTSVVTGAFERADPAGTEAQPEDDHSPEGTCCFVTGPLGGYVGDYDLDGGPTRLLSPPIDLSGGDAEIEFYLWFYHTDYGTQFPLQIHVTNDGSNWTLVKTVTHAPSWTFHSFHVADYVAPTANVQVRFTASDNPNDDIVEALVDDFAVRRYLFTPSLWADRYALSAATGGAVAFTLDAGAGAAGRKYILIGSFSGTTPGTPLPGGTVLPINWDVFTDLILLLLSTPVCPGFLGVMDGQGCASAALDTLGSLDPAIIGSTAHFAYCLGGPFNFASNAVGVSFVP